MRKLAAFFRVTFLWILLLPYFFTFVGAASNQAVLIANGDKFPVLLNIVKQHEYDVDANGFLDATHCLMTKNTHLNALEDIFDFHTDIYSVGDLLLETGDWLGSFCTFVWGAFAIAKLHKGMVV